MGTYELNILLHYNLDQNKNKTKNKTEKKTPQKQTKCEVRTKQTSSIQTDHSLVISNINNTKIYETCEYSSLLLEEFLRYYCIPIEKKIGLGVT